MPFIVCITPCMYLFGCRWSFGSARGIPFAKVVGEKFCRKDFLCGHHILFRNVKNRNRTAFFGLSAPSASCRRLLPDALFRTKKAALEVSQLEIGLRSPAHADVSTPELSSGRHHPFIAKNISTRMHITCPSSLLLKA